MRRRRRGARPAPYACVSYVKRLSRHRDKCYRVTTRPLRAQEQENGRFVKPGFSLGADQVLGPGALFPWPSGQSEERRAEGTPEAFVYCLSNASCSRTSPRDAGKLLLRTATRTSCSSPCTLLLHSRLLLADQGARNCEGWKKGWEKGARLAGRGRNSKRIACV